MMYVCALQELLENGTVQHFMTRALTLISMHVQVSNTAAADDHVVDDGNNVPNSSATFGTAHSLHCRATTASTSRLLWRQRPQRPPLAFGSTLAGRQPAPLPSPLLLKSSPHPLWSTSRRLWSRLQYIPPTLALARASVSARSHSAPPRRRTWHSVFVSRLYSSQVADFAARNSVVFLPKADGHTVGGKRVYTFGKHSV